MKDPLEESGNQTVDTPSPTASAAGTNGRPTKRRTAMPKRRTASRPHPARRVEPPHVVHHYESLVDEGENESFFGRHRAKIVVAVLVLLVSGAAYFIKPGSGSMPKAPERIVSI